MQQRPQNSPAIHVMAGLKRRRNPAMGLRMTAMIDVIFLLLTFFVLTARFKQPESYLETAFTKPAVGAAQPQPKKSLSIQLKSIETGCEIILADTDSVVLQSETLDANLTELAERFSVAASTYDVVNQPIELHCDNAVQWDYIVKIYDVLYRLGATKITFITEK